MSAMANMALLGWVPLLRRDDAGLGCTTGYEDVDEGEPQTAKIRHGGFNPGAYHAFCETGWCGR